MTLFPQPAISFFVDFSIRQFETLEKTSFPCSTSIFLISVQSAYAPYRSIGNFAFRECESLTSAVVPDKVKKIAWSTFDSCSSLVSVVISDGVTEIGECAFYNCQKLASVKLPNNLKTIGGLLQF